MGSAFSDEMASVRLEMKVRRDPETGEVYTAISKGKICRKLLLLKRINVRPEQIRIRRLAQSLLTQSQSANETESANDLSSIVDAGTYSVSLLLDEDYGYAFEFRLNVRHNEIARSNATPFAAVEGEHADADGDDDDDDDDAEADAKSKKMEAQELRSKLKKWSRAKHANEMLDRLVHSKSRYSHLYNISKLDLTPAQKTQIEK